MRFLPALLLAFLNSIEDPDKVPENVPVGPQTPKEIAEAREALLGKGDDEIFEEGVSPDAKFARMSRGRGLWPGYPGKGIVPYVISPELEEGRALILKAMEQYHEKTCIKFVPRTKQYSYINIVKGEGCSSSVGKVGGMQRLSLGKGCLYVGTIVHELGHAIGLHHEQKRSDRDKYIYIFRKHVKENKLHNFNVAQNIPEKVLSLPYNYDSIMHYGSYAFSKDPKNLVTMMAKNGQTLDEAYNKKGLNKGDILKISTLYKCRRKIAPQ